jgi:tRNA dimethylallyltransferase
MSGHTKKVPIILGPTSSGKTSLALRLCKDLDFEVVSVDSRQIFKHMDIGTGKLPIGKERSVIKHDTYWTIDDVSVWGYDLVSPGEYFSAVDMRNFVWEKIAEIHSRGKTALLVGGTGFYLGVITGAITPAPLDIDLSRREDLNALALPVLLDKLLSQAPDLYATVDKKNKVRVVRALERSMGLATSPVPSCVKPPVEFISLGLTSSRDLLYARADTWTGEIWANGLIPEVRTLIDMGYSTTPQLQGLVYKTVLEYLEGVLTEANAIQRIRFDLHAYIRRQQTWFKKYASNTIWFNILQDALYETVYNSIVKELH